MEHTKKMSPVVVVHGIGGGDSRTRVDFSQSLRELVLAGLDKTEHNAHWFEAPWEGINDLFDEQVKKIMEDFARRSRRPHLEDYAGKRCKWLNYMGAILKYCGRQVVLRGIVPQIADFLFDLPLYWGEPKGRLIRGKVREVVEAHPGCVLVGHSLGSLICYDLIREMSGEAGKETAVKALVTLGTPIGWVTRIRQAEGLAGPSGVGLPWRNLYHPSDPVCLHGGVDDQIFKGVVNRKIGVSTGRNTLREGVAAHVSYWKDTDVACTIAELSQE